ncbi:MAG: cytochrome c oxidase assembly protein [Candidatus Tyrphobacter sp.]
MSETRRSAWLCASAFVAGATVAPPFDRLADASFAWHMLQHLILFFIVPLLALLGRPFDLFVALAGKARTASFVVRTKPLHVLGSIPVAYAALLIAFWGTHFSPLYDLALRNEAVHVCEHALYVLMGTLFWLPVLAPPPLVPLPYPVRVFYLFACLPQSALVGAILFSARAPLYAHYAAIAGPVRALAQQHDAAAIMWIGGGLLLLCAMLSTMHAWAMREAS